MNLDDTSGTFRDKSQTKKNIQSMDGLRGFFHGKALSMRYASILRAVRRLSSAFLQVATDW